MGDILLRVHRSRYYYRIFSDYSCTYQGQSLISDPLSDAMIMPRLEGRLTCAVGLFNALINATIQSRRLLKFPRNASDAKQDSIEKQEQFIEEI